jgi:dimethylargininase
LSLAALTRAVSPRIDECELSHRERVKVDPERAAAQHRAYQAALEAAGCRVLAVRPAPDLPDSVFVEDTAVVTDDLAVIARPGARSRRPEVDAVAAMLERFRPLVRITAPGTLDGGDVLQVGRHVLVGRSGRTNAEGVAQLRTALEPHGYTVRPVPFNGCLHLKTAVTAIRQDTLLFNPGWVDPDELSGYRLLEVDPGEPFAANTLAVGGVVLAAAGAPATARRIGALGMDVVEVDVSELAKAEGGLTCCSILLRP